MTVLFRELEVADVDTLLVLAELHTMNEAPVRALRCYTAALALRPSHSDVWLKLVSTVFLS